MCRGHSTETEQQTPGAWSQASWLSSITGAQTSGPVPQVPGSAAGHRALMSSLSCRRGETRGGGLDSHSGLDHSLPQLPGRASPLQRLELWRQVAPRVDTVCNAVFQQGTETGVLRRHQESGLQPEGQCPRLASPSTRPGTLASGSSTMRLHSLWPGREGSPARSARLWVW